MIILGNEYQIAKEEKNKLYRVVKDIYYVDIVYDLDEQIIEDIKTYMSKNPVEFLVLNLEKNISLKVKNFFEEFDYKSVKIMLFSEFTSQFFNRCHIEFYATEERTNKRAYDKIISIISKRAFDFLFSLAALFFLSPLFLIIAILIKYNSPDGPIFFGHKRIGKDGKFFHVYKFRTMVSGAEQRLKKLLDENPEIRAEYEKDFKLKDDPRIVPGIGDFMRRSSLDELPQFFNSLIGDMSVVGPRPIVEDEVAKYGQYAIKLYSIKPGVTGLWQVSGRNDISYDERVMLDMEYIDKQSLMLDLKMIVQTVMVMVFRKGAY